MPSDRVRSKLKRIPTAPGIYRFYDETGTILYVGKARDLRHRVPSYFLRSNLDRGPRLAHLVETIADLDWQVTDSEIEALLLESRLIQEHKPKYNVAWRDDKSYLHIEINTAAPWPTIRLVRKSEVGRNRRAEYFGPYTSARALRIALKFIRRLLPYCEYSFGKGKSGQSQTKEGSWFNKPCLYYHLGLCPGVCAGEMSLPDYRQRLRQLGLFFKGKKEKVLTELEKNMERLSQHQEYEQAARLRNSWTALQHLQDISLRRGAFEESTMAQRGAWPHRIEAYDVSNIFGEYAVGVMVVFIDGQPDKNKYKRFKIKTVKGISDVGALVEVLERRFKHSSTSLGEDVEVWPLPNLLIIDGGKAQLNAMVKVMTKYGLQIPLMAVAKGRERKRADQYIYGPRVLSNEQLVRRIRDEAHRFAINYYRTLHRKEILIK